MTNENEKRFDDLAKAIADGGAIDWSMDSTRGDLDGPEVDALKVLAALRGRSSGKNAPSVVGTGSIERGFEIVRELGRGTFGSVLLARDKMLHREVALKVVREDLFAGADARERFLREARILAKLEHPNIVKIFSVDEADGKLRLTLERIDGKTLDQFVREQGPMSPEHAARVCIDLCSALSELHGAGLVHGDLKPQNVMRATNGRIVLLDFGIARDPRVESVELGRVVPQGTPLFMAPEVFDRLLPDGRADVFALGAVLHFLLSGSYPFPGTNTTAIREMHRRPPNFDLALRGAPTVLRRIIADCLAEDREKRPRNAQAVADRLQTFVNAPLRRRRNLALVAFAAVVVLGAYFALRDTTRGLVRADLLRVEANTESRLEDGDVVREGDRIVLDLETDRRTHVYVFNEDDRGALNLLFPEGRGGEADVIVKGREHLPRKSDGDKAEWILGDGGRAEYFAIVASKEPIRAVEAWLADTGARAAVPRDDDRSLVAAGDTRSVESVRATSGPEREKAPALELTRIGVLLDACRKETGVVTRVWRLNRHASN